MSKDFLVLCPNCGWLGVMKSDKFNCPNCSFEINAIEQKEWAEHTSNNFYLIEKDLEQHS